jgi:predicted transcriptional regulator
MKVKSASSAPHAVVTHPKAIAWLIRMENLKILEPFMTQALTISHAAQVLNISVNKMYKIIKRLEQLKLVQIVRREKRSGRSQCYYQAVSKEFFIGANKVSLDTVLNSLSASFEQGLNKGFETIWQEQGVLGHRIYLEKDGQISIRAASSPGVNWSRGNSDSALFNMWLVPTLDYNDACALQHDLQQVWEKYRYKKGSQRYIVRLAMVASSN